MRNDRVGRKRKNLEDKTSTIMFRIDNKTLFLLCDKFGIEYDKNLELVDSGTLKSLTVEIEAILRNIVK